MDLDIARLMTQSQLPPSPTGTPEDNCRRMPCRLRSTISHWAEQELVRDNPSIGIAVGHPNPLPGDDWDDPFSFIWFVTGWGENCFKYAANAVRKLRAVERTHRSTLDLRLNDPWLFQDEVESVVDGRFPWGDFPHGGGLLVNFGGLVVPCAVSALKQDEDEATAATVGSFVAMQMLRDSRPDVLA